MLGIPTQIAVDEKFNDFDHHIPLTRGLTPIGTNLSRWYNLNADQLRNNGDRAVNGVVAAQRTALGATSLIRHVIVPGHFAWMILCYRIGQFLTR